MDCSFYALRAMLYNKTADWVIDRIALIYAPILTSSGHSWNFNVKPDISFFNLKVFRRFSETETFYTSKFKHLWKTY